MFRKPSRTPDPDAPISADSDDYAVKKIAKKTENEETTRVSPMDDARPSKSHKSIELLAVPSMETTVTLQATATLTPEFAQPPSAPRLSPLARQPYIIAVRIIQFLHSLFDSQALERATAVSGTLNAMRLVQLSSLEPATADPYSSAPARLAMIPAGVRFYLSDLPPWRAMLHEFPRIPSARLTVWMARFLGVAVLLRAAGLTDMLESLGTNGLATILGIVCLIWTLQFMWWVVEIAEVALSRSPTPPPPPPPPQPRTSESFRLSHGHSTALGKPGASKIYGTLVSPGISDASGPSGSTSYGTCSPGISVTSRVFRTSDTIGTVGNKTASVSVKTSWKLSDPSVNPEPQSSRGPSRPLRKNGTSGTFKRRSALQRSSFSCNTSIPQAKGVPRRFTARPKIKALSKMASVLPTDFAEALSIIDATIAALRLIEYIHTIPKWKKTPATHSRKRGVKPTKKSSSSSVEHKESLVQCTWPMSSPGDSGQSTPKSSTTLPNVRII